jgi:hypothetical protein
VTSMGFAERLVTKVAERTQRFRTSRRGFLGGAALVGAALAVDPFGFLTRPASAYDAVCGSDNTCSAGYTVFCCTINGGANSCPPDSFIGGWWKADNSSFCGGNARYYIDCNAYRDGRYPCHCNSSTCDQRLVACNQFRYGQCNTQIPWSNTGPVLCRVVSCTPPWVQYGGTCSSSSATDNNTATHSAPCLSGNAPIGIVDSITSRGNVVTITGWAYDPDSPGTALGIAIYQNGKPRLGLTTSIHRTDVNNSRRIPGNHGFVATLTTSNGPQSFAVYALNVGAGRTNTRIGSRTINVNPGTAPIGRMDRCSTSNGAVTISGWAFDRDTTRSVLGIAIYQDGKPLMGIRTTVARSDVNSAYGITGTHGYTVTFHPSAGTHNYRVYALNAGGGTKNTLIGDHTLVVRAAAGAAVAGAYRWDGSGAEPASHLQARPTEPSALEPGGLQPSAMEPGGLEPGRLESVTASGGNVRLVGWAQHPSGQGQPVAIAVHADSGSDSGELHWYPADRARPELARSAGSSGQHGFDITIPAGPGVHTYTVHVLGSDGDYQPAELGSGTVRLGQAGPLGRLTDAHRFGDLIRLVGWAYDPDRPTAEVSVTVFRDGAAVSTHSTGGELLQTGDTAGNDGALGRPGFDIMVADPAGPHTYTVYARTPGSLGTPSLIGSHTVGSAEPSEPIEDRDMSGALL